MTQTPANFDYDVCIRGGMLVDGTGAPRRSGDLAIVDGNITAAGDCPGKAREEIDATGLIVSPGFIDIHTHYDAQVLWDRMLSISPWHGVTTVVMGNCGFGVAPTRPQHRELILKTLEGVEGMSLQALTEGIGEWPFETFPQFLQAVEDRGTAINVGALVGHTAVRTYVMGEDATEREATPDEVEQMAAIVSEALESGALGLATSKAGAHVGHSGKPVPSRAAAIEEIRTLADCLKGRDRGVLQVTAGRGLFLKQFAEIQKRIGRPISWTALLGGMMGKDGHREVLEKSAAMQAEGIDVIPQVSCRPLMVEFGLAKPFPLESMSLFKPVSEADRAGKKAIYADPEFRDAFKARAERGGIAGNFGKWTISRCEGDPELVERNVAEVAVERGVHPVDLVLDLALESDLRALFRVAAANDDDDVVAELITHHSVMLGLSDAGAHASQLCDANFATHLLSYWVRHKEVLGLEEAVRMLTTRVAEVFGIEGRGQLAPGMAADVVLFDQATVGCSPLRRVHDLPAGEDRLISDACGIHRVIVNGTTIRRNNEDCVGPKGALPGRLLRGGTA